jgi:hypothetical protein
LKKVLIVSYYFPPRPAVGGLRPLGLAKYLPEFGWEAVVLTAKLPGRPAQGVEVIETPYEDTFGLGKKLLGLDSQQNIMSQVAQLKKRLHITSEKSPLDFILTAWGAVAAYPDPQKRWRAHALRAGDECLRQGLVDVILSTSSPPTSHIVARALKEKHGIPWVADFRDLWTQNHYYPYSPVRRAIEHRLELRTLSKANALVTISEPLAQELASLHKGRPIHVVTNGFDPAEVNSPAAALTSKFTITYTGNLYPGKQTPEPLFAALRELVAQGTVAPNDLEVRFFGPELPWVDRLAERYGLRQQVRQFGLVPRDVALAGQRESQLLLLMKWNDPGQKGVYQAKLFEYLAARRPVLAIGGYRDVVNELLDETGAGASGLTPDDLAGILKRFYNEYREAGRVAFRGDDSRIGKYSQREMARRYAEVLDEVSRLSLRAA